MQFANLVAGHFVQWNNRFRVTVIVDGSKTAAHLPNSGKLSDLLTPHRRVWLTRVENSRRKTAYDLTLVELDTGLVSIDARKRRSSWEKKTMSDIEEISLDRQALYPCH